MKAERSRTFDSTRAPGASLRAGDCFTGRRRLALAVLVAAMVGFSLGGANAQNMAGESQWSDQAANTAQQSSGANSQQSSAMQSGATTGQASASPFTGAVQATQPVAILAGQNGAEDQGQAGADLATQSRMMAPPSQIIPRRIAPPGEFELFVKSVLGRPMPRFGASLMTGAGRDFKPDVTTTVPPDYTLNPGDELLIGLTGSVESSMPLIIDRDGRVFIPRVGAVTVAGVRYGDLPALLAERIGKQFRDFKVSVAISKLHGIRVYVTGYALSPGAYTLGSLSTLVNAVMAAGGPSPGGSFRTVELRRNGELVTRFDFYDLLLKGDKSRDVLLRNEDVLYIAPVGPEVALAGSLNAEAIYEAKAGETLGDLLRYAGGLSSLADPSRVFVSRLSNLDKMGWQQLDLAEALRSPVQQGDILRVASVADYARPLERQAIVVKIEGEIDRPGRYYLKPDSTVADLLAQAGGLTSRAFVFGSELDRVTVKQQQQIAFDQAVRDTELAIAASPLTTTRLDQAAGTAAQTARVQVAHEVIDQLKAHKPDGRLVLPLTPRSAGLPGDLILENDDRLYVPPQPTTVGVFGAVFQPGSFLYKPGQTVADYLKEAGGPQKLAEKGEVFVVRANGSVISQRQLGSTRFEREAALPGDVIFMPIRTEPDLWFAKLMDAGTLIYQFGLGVAALKVLGL